MIVYNGIKTAGELGKERNLVKLGEILIQLRQICLRGVLARYSRVSKAKAMEISDIVSYDLLTHGRIIRFQELRDVFGKIRKPDYKQLAEFALSEISEEYINLLNTKEQASQDECAA